MITNLYISRARLRSSRGEVLSAVAPLLIPEDASRRPGYAHRVLWLLFQDVPDAERDFLWRDEGGGRYMILSRRQPSDPHGLFEIETKLFSPVLKPGDKVRFALRANPVITTKRAGTTTAPNGKIRGKKTDVVMDALHKIPKGERSKIRDKIASDAGAQWLKSQGERAGFTLAGQPAVEGYAQIPVEGRRGRPAGFSVLDLRGVIEITDPPIFLDKLASGFGSAKAFGNGLMLISRA
jgi:CRISPR system Cascade subunit CasE